MKILTFFLLFILFCINSAFALSAQEKLEKARVALDTPFIKGGRALYEANDSNLGFIHLYLMKKCRKDCSPQDYQNMERLAELGDKFSLFMLPFTLPYLETIPNSRYIKQWSAERGESYIAGFVVLSNVTNNYQNAVYYGTKALNGEKFYMVHRWLAIAHKRNGKTKEYCDVTGEGYKKYGIEFLSSYFIRNDNNSDFFFKNCTKQSPDDILAKIDPKERDLLKGYAHVHKKEYAEAFGIFSKLYSPKDKSKISANAGYCLGQMYYNGKGVKKSKEKGNRFLEESFDRGIFYPRDDNSSLESPRKLEVINYSGGLCGAIDK